MSNVVDKYLSQYYEDKDRRIDDVVSKISGLVDTAIDIVRKIKTDPKSIDKVMNLEFNLDNDGNIVYIDAVILFYQAAIIQGVNIKQSEILHICVCYMDRVKDLIDESIFDEIFGIQYELEKYEGRAYFVKKNPSWIEFMQYNLGMIKKSHIFILMCVPIIGVAIIGIAFWYSLVYIYIGIKKYA